MNLINYLFYYLINHLLIKEIYFEFNDLLLILTLLIILLNFQLIKFDSLLSRNIFKSMLAIIYLF